MSAQSKWNEEAEVIVLGYGGAGACTAINAHDAGRKGAYPGEAAC